MTNTSFDEEMPDRIWATAQGDWWDETTKWDQEGIFVEYIRADKIGDYLREQVDRFARRGYVEVTLEEYRRQLEEIEQGKAARAEFASRDEQLHGDGGWCGTDNDWDVQF